MGWMNKDLFSWYIGLIDILTFRFKDKQSIKIPLFRIELFGNKLKNKALNVSMNLNYIVVYNKAVVSLKLILQSDTHYQDIINLIIHSFPFD